VNRESIYSALFAALAGVTGLNTVSRRLKHYEDVSPAEQPALFMTATSQNGSQTKGLPSIYYLDSKIWIYVHETDKSIAPSTGLNNILDKIDAVLKPAIPGNKQTLGGLVEHCWVDGEIVTDEGSLGDQAVAILTIKMQTTT